MKIIKTSGYKAAEYVDFNHFKCDVCGDIVNFDDQPEAHMVNFTDGTTGEICDNCAEEERISNIESKLHAPFGAHDIHGDSGFYME